MPETLLVDVRDRVATITLDRPQVRNAINARMVDEMHAALDALEPREDVLALVVRGAGGKAFASGADIAELRERRREDALRGINGGLFQHLERFRRPTVAAVVGFLTAILLAVAGMVWYPVKRMLRGKRAAAPAGAADLRPAPEQRSQDTEP